MNFKELQQEMISALKTGNKTRKQVLSGILSLAKILAIDNKKVTEDELVQEAILKTRKICLEQIEKCPANREDLLAEFNENLRYINEYAPTQLSTIEILQVIGETYEKTKCDKMGILIKNVMSKVKGQADGAVVNQLIRQFWNNKTE